jgi:hypothetical protein
MQKKMYAMMVILMLCASSISLITIKADDGSFAPSLDYQPQPPAITNWTFKPGYDNCTQGPPDFDQKQFDWYDDFLGKWCYCGPVAALDCLWWLDCKKYNGTNGTFLNNWLGLGSHHPYNVKWLVESLACNMSMEWAVAANDRSGVNSSNFTRGLYRMFNNWSINNTMNVEIEGETDNGVVDEVVNWSNMTTHLDNCHDVILLLGFYCFDGIGYGNRYGGHYVQCNGYSNVSNLSLSFSDPYYDRAENGRWGWNSTHTHSLYGTGSHNWTQNVSYDFYEVNTSSEWATGASELVNYTNGSIDDFNGTNWFGTMYQETGPCVGEIRAVIEMAWYIWEESNLTANQTVWNSSSGRYEEDLPLAQPGTQQFNFTMKNLGTSITNNLTIFTTHYDCLSYYIPNSAMIMYPNGTWSQFEPIRGWESETCSYAGHGHLTWCIESDNLSEFNLNQTIHILYNMSYNCTNYSKNIARIYLCSSGEWCQNCISYYDNSWNATNCSVGRQFDNSITCWHNTSEYSDWAISEHVNRPCVNSGCLDEQWSEHSTEFDRWVPWNTSIVHDGTYKDWEWVYRFNDLDGAGTDSSRLSYTIVNFSSANRTEAVLRMRYNVTEYGTCEVDPYLGIIYSFTNDSYYHMVLYAYNEVFLLTKNGTDLYNTNDSTPVLAPGGAYNYWNQTWSCNGSIVQDNFNPDMNTEPGSGIWSKTNWNPYCKRLQTKAWNITSANPFGLAFEPSGWIYDSKVVNCSENCTNFSYQFVLHNMNAVLDYNHPSNETGGTSGVGQTFTTPNDGKTHDLCKASFWLGETGDVTGNLYAALYETQEDLLGNSNWTAVGQPLAVSESLPADILAGPSNKYEFIFTDTYPMQPNTRYAIVVHLNGWGNFTNYIEVAGTTMIDWEGSEQNEVWYAGQYSGWNSSDNDIFFEIWESSSENFNDNACFGLVAWNPGKQCGLKWYAEYDFIELWKSNYSRDENANASQIENHSIYGSDGIPLNYFKAFPAANYTAYYQTWNTTCQWPYENGSLTAQQYADCSACFFRNITHLYNFESRAYRKPRNCTISAINNSQNDTIYYYTGLGTALPDVSNITDYNNALFLQIIDTTDGHSDWGDGAVVCVDVDNDLEWDDNDWAFVWYDDMGVGTRFFMWNGTELFMNGYSPDANTTARFWANWSDAPYDWLAGIIDSDSSSLLPALHRYSHHRVYSAWIPAMFFIKEDGEYLNTTDTFGLHIMNIDAGPGGVPPGSSVVVWEDWNETSCRNYRSNANGSSVWDEYLNCSNYTAIEDFYTYGNGWAGVNISNMQYWAHGRLGNETGYLNQSYFSTSTSIASNVTLLENITDDQLVRYDITICNAGDSNLTNATVSFQTLTTANIVATNATSFYNYSSGGYSNYVFNVTQWINTSNCSMIWILVNFTANYVPNGSIVNTWFTSAADQPGATSQANYSFEYGSNFAPIINWTYPSNGSSGVTIPLSNISLGIYEPDGDEIQVYINSNKTSSWTPGSANISAIGEFNTIGSSSISFGPTVHTGAQSFTIGTTGTNATINITQVVLKGYRFSSPNTVWVNITTMNETIPWFPNETNVLSTGTFNGSNLTTDGSGQLIVVNMTPYNLTAGTQYGCIVTAPYTNDVDRMNLRISLTECYAGGNLTYKPGDYWSATDYETVFELHGRFYGSGTYVCNQTFNNSQRFNTKWRWGDTTYYWYVNVTDGTVWVNETYSYTSGSSRYDANTDYTVDVFDLSTTWANRAGIETYLGIYDVNADSIVDVFDLSAVWANRS